MMEAAPLLALLAQAEAVLAEAWQASFELQTLNPKP